MKIFLVGFMGCGKSTIGRQLAKKLGYAFLDVDKYIEDKQGCTIPEIFAQKGEAYFRECERDSIREISHVSNTVVATGGGAPTFYDNMEFMNRCGVTLYLKMDSSTLVNRVMNSSSPRPLLMGKTREQMISTVDEMLGERSKYYELASIVMCGKDIKVNEVLEEIKKW